MQNKKILLLLAITLLLFRDISFAKDITPAGNAVVEKNLVATPEITQEISLHRHKGPIVVATHRDKDHLIVSASDKKGLIATLDTKFDKDTKLSDFSGRTAQGESLIQFSASDNKYLVTYYWHLQSNTLYYKTVRLSDQKAFFSKNLNNNPALSSLAKDPQAEAKYTEATTFLNMFDFIMSNGYVPALDENLDPSMLVQNEYSIKKFDDKMLSLHTVSCWGSSVLCKEKDLYFTWDGTSWVPGMAKNKIEDPPSTVESIDLNGDSIEEKIAFIEDCFRDSCQYAWKLFSLSDDGRKYEEAIHWEGGGTFEGCAPNTRIKYSIDKTTKPFVTIVLEESTQIKVKSNPNSNYCEPEGWDKKIIRYQWDEKLQRFYDNL